MAALRFAGDPRWITARYSTRCSRCTVPINKGDNAFYYPGSKTIYCAGECGQTESNNFNSYADDDDSMFGQFSGMALDYCGGR
jgi:hypothetical protein